MNNTLTRTKSKARQAAGVADTVTLRRAEYERLLAKAGEPVEGDGPPLPKPDVQGNFPAVDYLRASIARELIRRRKVAGLSQTALAKRAGVRQETISRLESGKHTVSGRVMEKIERALQRVRKDAAKG
ncbi:MAG: helix-turn-helix transcriptional regulator [Tepidisphaeraceae bacterium]